MALSKDKEKVLDEVLDDKRIESFLHIMPPNGVNADYHCLERAYRGMIERDFATFMPLFIAAGKDINAKNPQGKTFLEVISTHKTAGQFIALLKQHGAS